ncbi:hypothetical protein HA466_0185700 [Hirschfeldia incana]|nr:hypothetical protein HA466_0185700 [Hirschfeldia incana]
MATQQQQQHRGEEVEKALVIWNISNCPIPDGHDPFMVVDRIQTALGLVRPYGEISMTAVGNNLTQIPGGEDFMRKLSSLGISLKHTYNYHMDLHRWACRNPPPATMMLIDDYEQLGSLAPALYDFKDGGYRILIAYPQRQRLHLAKPFPRPFTNQGYWDDLFSYQLDAATTTTTTRILVNKCNDHRWSCSVCFLAAPSFDDFTTHLKSVKHEFSEWSRHASKYALDRTTRSNLPFGRSQELDLLLSQEMLRCQEEIRWHKCRQPGRGFRPKYRSNSQSKY